MSEKGCKQYTNKAINPHKYFKGDVELKTLGQANSKYSEPRDQAWPKDSLQL